MKRKFKPLGKTTLTIAFIEVFIFGILFLLPILNLPANHSSSSEAAFDTPSSLSYTWIWDEYADAPERVIGDDPIIWGTNLGPYYNYAELTQKLFSLQSNFEFVDLFSIGKSHKGREIWTVRLTNRSVTSQKSEFHLVAHHHAREAITIVNALYFIDKLVYEITMENASVKDLISNMEIYITPSLNPDGLELMATFPWMRKNQAPIDDDNDGLISDEDEIFDRDGDGYVARYNYGEYYEGIDGSDQDSVFGEDAPGGVDLNRNYDYEFIGSGSSPNPSSFTYRGEYPFSEPETQAICDFVSQHDFNFAISLHSGIKAIIGPWGYTNTPAPDQIEIDAIVSKLSSVTGYPTWEEIGGYNVNGEWGDWMYGIEGVFAFTLETYVDYSEYARYGRNPVIERGIWDVYNPPGNEALAKSQPVWNALNYILTEPQETIVNGKPAISVDNTTEQFSGGNITLSWQASDPDNDSLLYNVYLSEDGFYWTRIGTDLNATSFEFSSSKHLENSKSYFIKIAADDGINSVFDIAEEKLQGSDAAGSSVNVKGIRSGEILTGIREIEVEVENELEVEKIVMLVDHKEFAVDNKPPFKFIWNANQESEGQHTVIFQIHYKDGDAAKSEFAVYTYITITNEVTETSSKRASVNIAGNLAFLFAAGLILNRKRR
ncbi:MAG: M14 family zinc carboxypeptidase [Candidatus Hodarchaeota archaeon]